VKYFRNLRSHYVDTYFVKSPFKLTGLSIKDRKNVKFCEKFVHRIFWQFGTVQQKRLKAILNIYLQSGCRIYVKGQLKQTVLQKLLGCDYIYTNLEDLDCPKLHELPLETKATKCILPFHQDLLNCSHVKVLALKKFLLSQ